MKVSIRLNNPPKPEMIFYKNILIFKNEQAHLLEFFEYDIPRAEPNQ